MEKIKDLKVRKKCIYLTMGGMALTELLSGCTNEAITYVESSSKFFAPGEHLLTVTLPYNGQPILEIEPGYEIVDVSYQGDVETVTYRNIDSVLCTIPNSTSSNDLDFNTFGEPLGMGDSLSYEPTNPIVPVR